MSKKNCWEFKECGREPGGKKVSDLGECPAAKEKKADGINDGKNGGRSCWALTGTLCGGIVQGTFAHKIINCMKCEFYKLVKKEQGKDFTPSKEIIEKVKGKEGN